MSQLPVLRTIKDARAHDPGKPALIEVPGKWVGAVVTLLTILQHHGHDEVGKRIEALRALSRSRVVTGVLVTNIGPDSQAAKAGIARADVLLRYDGIPLDESEKLKGLTERTDASKKVTIDAARGEQNLVFHVFGGPLGMTVAHLSTRKSASVYQ